MSFSDQAQRQMTAFVDRNRNFIRNWLEAAPRERGGIWVNRMGLQVARVIYEQALISMRPRRLHPEFAKYEQELDCAGITVVPNLLSEEDFAKISEAYERVGASSKIKVEPDKDGWGVDWYTARIDNGRETSDAERLLVKKIACHPAVIGLAEHILRRRIANPPTLSYQRLVVRPEFKDDKDRERVMHADRHYPCVKMAYHLRPTAKAQGAYIFAPGSHRVTAARLRHEYEYSIRQAQVKKHGIGVVDPTLIACGRNRVSDACASEMGLQEVSMEVPANTLIASNNMGFHARGTIEPGEERHQIRILFYYVQAPFLSRMLMRVKDRLNRRSDLR